MIIRHGNTGKHGADNSQKALIGAAQIQICDVCSAVQPFLWSTVHAPVHMPGETTDRFGGEGVGIDNVGTVIRQIRQSSFTDPFSLGLFFTDIGFIIQTEPEVVIGQSGNANHPFFQTISVLEIVG